MLNNQGCLKFKHLLVQNVKHLFKQPLLNNRCCSKFMHLVAQIVKHQVLNNLGCSKRYVENMMVVQDGCLK
jgi:hypothetical protein